MRSPRGPDRAPPNRRDFAESTLSKVPAFIVRSTQTQRQQIPKNEASAITFGKLLELEWISRSSRTARLLERQIAGAGARSGIAKHDLVSCADDPPDNPIAKTTAMNAHPRPRINMWLFIQNWCAGRSWLTERTTSRLDDARERASEYTRDTFRSRPQSRMQDQSARVGSLGKPSPSTTH